MLCWRVVSRRINRISVGLMVWRRLLVRKLIIALMMRTSGVVLLNSLVMLRMVIRLSVGMLSRPFDGMQIQAPRLVLAEAAMDMLFFSYADPVLAAEVILGHFESAPRPNLPCMREDGSYNMVADD